VLEYKYLMYQTSMFVVRYFSWKWSVSLLCVNLLRLVQLRQLTKLTLSHNKLTGSAMCIYVIDMLC
jgi:hypothetical protein